jgi:hypothetical protein
MGASAIELRGKFGVMDDDRDRDPRTSGKASEVDSRSLSLNLSFPSLNNKAHMHMHWPESDATCIYTVDAWCSGAIRLNQSATASACAVLLCSDHHRIDSFCSRGRGLGGQVTIGLGPAGCCCSMMATYRRVEKSDGSGG